MFATLHVVLAITSIAMTTYTAWKPSRVKLHSTYGLCLSTIITGITLTILSPHMLLQACTTGLFYIGFILSTIKIAHRRLQVVV